MTLALRNKQLLVLLIIAFIALAVIGFLVTNTLLHSSVHPALAAWAQNQ